MHPYSRPLSADNIHILIAYIGQIGHIDLSACVHAGRSMENIWKLNLVFKLFNEFTQMLLSTYD